MVMSKDENENEKEGRTKQNEPDAERPPPARTWETARAARYLRGYTGQDAQPPRGYERGHVFKYDFKGGEYVKDFFKCTAIVLAVIVFGLALSAIVHWPQPKRRAQARRH